MEIGDFDPKNPLNRISWSIRGLNRAEFLGQSPNEPGISIFRSANTRNGVIGGDMVRGGGVKLRIQGFQIGFYLKKTQANSSNFQNQRGVAVFIRLSGINQNINMLVRHVKVFNTSIAYIHPGVVANDHIFRDLGES